MYGILWCMEVFHLNVVKRFKQQGLSCLRNPHLHQGNRNAVLCFLLISSFVSHILASVHLEFICACDVWKESNLVFPDGLPVAVPAPFQALVFLVSRGPNILSPASTPTAHPRICLWKGWALGTVTSLPVTGRAQLEPVAVAETFWKGLQRRACISFLWLP